MNDEQYMDGPGDGDTYKLWKLAKEQLAATRTTNALLDGILSELRGLRRPPAPEGYWWVIREDADGNEVSRELKPLDPPNA